MRLPTTPPFDGAALLAFLAARAIDGVEAVDGGTYRRTLALPGGPATIAVAPRAEGDGADLEAALADPADEPHAIAVARALFGLDQDPAAVLAGLGADPVLGPLVRARPGLRVPGTPSGFEAAVRAVVGQQVSVAAARRLLSRLAVAAGDRADVPGEETLLFPSPPALAAAPEAAFTMPRSRARAARARARRSAAVRRRRRRPAHRALRHRPVDGGLRRAADGRPGRLPRRRRRGARVAGAARGHDRRRATMGAFPQPCRPASLGKPRQPCRAGANRWRSPRADRVSLTG